MSKALAGEPAVRAYAEYTDRLDALVREAARAPLPPQTAEQVAAALDGQAASELRRLVPLADLRADGIFFTGSQLAADAVRDLLPTFDRDSLVLDPACGVGDLLIACTAGLSIAASRAATLHSWGARLAGRDLHPELVEAARRRLLLAAFRRQEGDCERLDLSRAFPQLQSCCGLSDPRAIAAATHIVLNPPFALVDAPAGCTWAAGKVNAAALFVEAMVSHARPGCRIAAILPDVLRSGSRYHRWRDLVTAKAHLDRIELAGQFDRWADVDVFLLQLQIRTPGEALRRLPWHSATTTSERYLNDLFELCIGPVVDYRDPHTGPAHPFIHSRDLPPWQTVRTIDRRRHFAGRVLTPPFVAVRRTSRPGDPHRAIGTLIAGDRPVAVENHLIALLPRDGTQRSCRELLRRLRDVRTTRWLDQRIRCRHLTVAALRDLPWWSEAP